MATPARWQSIPVDAAERRPTGNDPPLRLEGAPLKLAEYAARTRTNRRFVGFDLSNWDRYYLPASLEPLTDDPPLAHRAFLDDDNRSAVAPDPVATLDGVAFYLSVKGVGSSVDPYSERRLDRALAAEVSDSPDVRQRLRAAGADPGGGVVTGELWLRGSPYGGQGEEHASTALRVSEAADLTTLAGFRLAPVVKVAELPDPLAERLRSISWYRRFRGRIVQELRLVPSNVRVYFHARTTVGSDIGRVFDRFRIDRPDRAHRFEVNLLKSGLAVLTLFARTLERDPVSGRCSGFDFLDVWLDKDAVLAPDGTVFFVDLEGLERVTVEREAVREKVEDQIYRSLYELMFAFEQVAGERARRFGSAGSRRRHFEAIMTEAVQGDPFLRIRSTEDASILEVRNSVGDESLNLVFPLLDR